LPERLQTASKAVQEFVLAGLNNAMNNYNGK
jgi:PTH1 family peptidyl-tRNA hydrolase